MSEDMCKCRIVPIGYGVTVEFCPMHAAAPELLEALKEAVSSQYNPFEPDNQDARYHRWTALIAKAQAAS